MDKTNPETVSQRTAPKTTIHTSRTMMLSELTALLSLAPPDADKAVYRRMIIEDNILNKPTLNTRRLTAKRLGELYLLNPQNPTFRVMRQLWFVDPEGRPLLAFLAARKRDTLLRMSAEFILGTSCGDVITSSNMEQFIEVRLPGRFGPKTLRSVSQNLNSSFTQAGYLSGKVRKKRIQVKATTGVAAYALFLAYLEGARAERLFEGLWARLLDCPPDSVHRFALAASQRGWLDYRNAGGVVEVRFPHLLTEKERRSLDE